MAKWTFATSGATTRGDAFGHLVPRPGPLAERPKYAELETPALVPLLRDSSLTVRQFARLELKRRSVDEVRPVVATWVDAAQTPSERQHRAMEAMWIDECLDVVDAARIAEVFAAEDGRIRAAAVRTVGRRREGWRPAEGRSCVPRCGIPRHGCVSKRSRHWDVERWRRMWSWPWCRSTCRWTTRSILLSGIRCAARTWTPRLAGGEFDFGGDPRRLRIFAVRIGIVRGRGAGDSGHPG